MRPPRGRRARARIALALCVVWIAGFEVVPWLHVALHDQLGAHHHDATGALILDRDRDSQVDEHAPDHDHDDLDGDVDEHGAPVHHHAPAAPADRRLGDALVHGQHSLAHHGIAVPAPSPVLTSPLPVDRRPTFVAAVAMDAPIASSPGRAVARGPPVSLLG